MLGSYGAGRTIDWTSSSFIHYWLLIIDLCNVWEDGPTSPGTNYILMYEKVEFIGYNGTVMALYNQIALRWSNYLLFHWPWMELIGNLHNMYNKDYSFKYIIPIQYYYYFKVWKKIICKNKYVTSIEVWANILIHMMGSMFTWGQLASLKMSQMFERMLIVISQPPSERSDFQIDVLLPWLRKKSELLAGLEKGKRKVMFWLWYV